MKFFPNIDDQAAAMAETFPAIKLVGRKDSIGLWRGPVRPFFQQHVIQIVYRVPLVIERLDLLRLQPRVSVLDPLLRPRKGADTPLPHVYWQDGAPFLCLFSPEFADWTPQDLLSETTVPFAIDWLACYEGWRVTGEWSGGGRHAQPSPASGDT